MTGYLARLRDAGFATLFSPDSRFFLPWLIVTGAIALGLCLWRSRDLAQAARALLRADVFLHPSAIADYKLGALNLPLLTSVLGVGVFGTYLYSDAAAGALRFVFGPSPAWQAGPVDAVAASLALFLCYDGGNFLQHWLQHRSPLLWELHKVHHSAEVMTPVTAVRVHPLAELFATLVLSIMVGTVNGALLYLYAGHLAALTILGTNAFIVLHYTIGVYHLQHSHLWLRFPPVLRSIFISPAAHWIHHSKNPLHFDKNFGFALTVWDRLAGTFHPPQDSERHGLVIGIADDEQPAMRRVRDLYATPLRRIWRMRGRDRLR